MVTISKGEYLSDIIEYDIDIEPYNFIKIYAGVGSGKNTFIDNLVKGNIIKNSDGTTVKKKYVLLITSRRAKVNEQLKSLDTVYDPKIGMFDLDSYDFLYTDDEKYNDYFESELKELDDLDGWGTKNVYLRSCVNTNAKLESTLKWNYVETNSSSHPWDRFDLIVVDEVHALLADASYQTAPFYVRRLIEETIKRQIQGETNCKVIVMTGTPKILEKHSLFNKTDHCIDVTNICKSVIPEQLEFITRTEAEKIENKYIEDNIPFVTFYGRIGSIKSFVSSVEKKYHAQIAVSFSDQEQRGKLRTFSSAIYENMIKTEKSLSNDKMIPDNIVAFITNSRNKEGINITNDNFNYMFIDAHNEVDIIQMAGRVRCSVKKMYIIVDSPKDSDKENMWEQPFSQDQYILSHLNEYFKMKLVENTCYFEDGNIYKPVSCFEKIKEFIQFIHNKFPYIRYDYFTNLFTYYTERELSRSFYAEQDILYNIAMKSESELIKYAHMIYANIPCTIHSSVKFDIQNKVDAYLSENHWLNGERKIGKEERDEIIEAINKISGTDKKRIGACLNPYGYKNYPLTKSHKEVNIKIVSNS